jgi:hypothetical protein
MRPRKFGQPSDRDYSSSKSTTANMPNLVSRNNVTHVCIRADEPGRLIESAMPNVPDEYRWILWLNPLFSLLQATGDRCSVRALSRCLRWLTLS